MNDELEKCTNSLEEASSREELLEELARCLKNKREARNLNLEEIALTLKLRTVYLEALESGDWGEMPGEVYALGFLKQYASYLGLDVSDSIEKLKTGHYKLTKPLTFPDPPIAPSRTWVIVAALAFVVLIILFNLFDSGEPQQPLTAPTVTSEVETTPETAVSQENDSGGTVTDSTSTEAEPAETGSESPDLTPDAALTHAYELAAVGGDVWLQVSVEPVTEEETPALLQEVLLRDGETVSISHASPSLLLTCGNAAALQVKVDGTVTAAAGSLGESGKVLRNFRIAAEE